MARVNHAREKRLKELERQRKQEAKRAKRLNKDADGVETEGLALEDASEAPAPLDAEPAEGL